GIKLKVGGSYILDPTIDIDVPARFTFESEDEGIATVSKDGVVKGVSEGETIITIHAEQEDPDPNYADITDMDIWIEVVSKDSSEDAAERMDAVHDKLAQVLQMLADALIKQNADEITKLKQQIADLNNQLSKTSRKTNTLAVKGRKATVKYKSLKKKAKSLKVTKVIKFKKKGQGTKIYAKAAGNRKITINKKTGKVTMKKGMKKGLYKVKVRVKAKGNTKYKPSPWKTVTFKVRVK
ncbi:MAG: Ig-like domain-containing protein, partial [Anaerovoracaceae bacterium]|nr:Ig-like domain-containing protein [Anaerovoracaceae bacterium]